MTSQEKKDHEGANPASNSTERKGFQELAFRLIGLVLGFLAAGLASGLAIGHFTQSFFIFPFGSSTLDPTFTILLLLLATACGLFCYAAVGWRLEVKKGALRKEKFKQIRALIEQERKSFEALKTVWKEKEKAWESERQKWQARYQAWSKLKEKWKAQMKELAQEIEEAKKGQGRTEEKLKLAAELQEKLKELEAVLNEKRKEEEKLKQDLAELEEERKDLSEKLKQSQREIESLNEEVNKLKKELSEKERKEKEMILQITSKEEELSFLLRLSSALKSPIQRLAQVARNNSRKPQERLCEITACAERFLKTLDAILDIAKVKKGSWRFTISEVSLERVISRVVARFEPEAKERQIELRWPQKGDDLGRVLLDERILERCLEVLLQNAIQWNHRGGWVKIEAKIAADEKGKIAKVQVTDSGLGIPDQMHGEIFKPFTRAVQPSTHVTEAGPGIGLTLAKALAEAHGGEISLKSKPSQGSTFLLALPELTQTEEENPQEVFILENAEENS